MVPLLGRALLERNLVELRNRDRVVLQRVLEPARKQPHKVLQQLCTCRCKALRVPRRLGIVGEFRLDKDRAVARHSGHEQVHGQVGTVLGLLVDKAVDALGQQARVHEQKVGRQQHQVGAHQRVRARAADACQVVGPVPVLVNERLLRKQAGGCAGWRGAAGCRLCVVVVDVDGVKVKDLLLAVVACKEPNQAVLVGAPGLERNLELFAVGEVLVGGQEDGLCGQAVDGVPDVVDRLVAAKENLDKGRLLQVAVLVEDGGRHAVACVPRNVDLGNDCAGHVAVVKDGVLEALQRPPLCDQDTELVEHALALVGRVLVQQRSLFARFGHALAVGPHWPFRVKDVDAQVLGNLAVGARPEVVHGNVKVLAPVLVRAGEKVPWLCLARVVDHLCLDL